MNLNSLADQLGWCITTKEHLNHLNSEMLFTKTRYENMVMNLRQARYMREFLPAIEQMSADFSEEINNLVKYITDEHLPYIQIQADATASTINSAFQISGQKQS